MSTFQELVDQFNAVVCTADPHRDSYLFEAADILSSLKGFLENDPDAKTIELYGSCWATLERCYDITPDFIGKYFGNIVSSCTVDDEVEGIFKKTTLDLSMDKVAHLFKVVIRHNRKHCVKDKPFHAERFLSKTKVEKHYRAGGYSTYTPFSTVPGSMLSLFEMASIPINRTITHLGNILFNEVPTFKTIFDNIGIIHSIKIMLDEVRHRQLFFDALADDPTGGSTMWTFTDRGNIAISTPRSFTLEFIYKTTEELDDDPTMLHVRVSITPSNGIQKTMELKLNHPR